MNLALLLSFVAVCNAQMNSGDEPATPAPASHPAPKMDHNMIIPGDMPAPSGDHPAPSANSQPVPTTRAPETRDLIFVEMKSLGTSQTCDPSNGNKVDQPCMASSPCDDTKCRDFCLQNTDCWFYSHNSQNGCLLYKDCGNTHTVRLTTKTYGAHKPTMLSKQSCPATCHPGSDFSNNQSCDDLLKNHPDKYQSCDDLTRYGCFCGGCECKPPQQSQQSQEFVLKFKLTKTICNPQRYKIAQPCTMASKCDEDSCKNYCKTNSGCKFAQYIPQNGGCVLHNGCDQTSQARFASNTYEKNLNANIAALFEG